MMALGKCFLGMKKKKGMGKNKKSFMIKLSKKTMDYLTTFFNDTTIHGLRHIVTPGRHLFERLFWVAMVIFVSLFAGQLGFGQIVRYLTNPTVVSIKKDYRDWTINFPAITVCLNEKIDADAADRFIEQTWNLTKESNSEKYEYYYDYVNLVATIFFRSNLRLFWKFENDTSFNGVKLIDVAASVFPNVTIRSSFHDRSHVAIWETVMTEMGLCLTFNSLFAKFQSVKTWRKQLNNINEFSSDTTEKQLLKCHYMNRHCYARFSILNGIGKFYIHSPYELAESLSNPTSVVGEGEEFDATFGMLQIKAADDVRSLSAAQRHCKYPDESVSVNLPAYSNVLCQNECRSRMAAIFCGCRPYFYAVGDGEMCDTKGMGCIGRSMEILISLPENLAKCQCLPQCTEINYIPQNQKIASRNITAQSIFDRQSSIKIAVQMPKLLLSKDVIFSFEDLVASFGGVGALFMGISFISLMEILICLCKPCKAYMISSTKKLTGRFNC